MAQSYLIVGKNSREETEKLAKSKGVHLKKASTDIYFINPLESAGAAKHQSISIDEIRNLKSHIFQKPIKEPFKFIVIEQAETLTQEAQNALLKILEEPPESAIIVLETSSKTALLPTIQSRTTAIFTKQKQSTAEESLLLKEMSLQNLLEEIAQVENPLEWLDEQVLALHQTLKNKVKGTKTTPRVTQIIELIEKCTEANQMIKANVNPKFVLANLAFTITNR